MTAPRPRLLVVEPDVPTRRFLTLLLEDEAYQVTAVATQAEATALLAGTSFDLVLTDSLCPKAVSTFAGVANIRHAAGCTPVVLLSAHRLDSAAAQAAGFAWVLAKPFDVQEFVTQLQALLPTAAST